MLALFADSTNIERPGFTGSESDVVEAFEEIFASTRGKLIVTAFATSIYRMQILANLAQEFGRKLAFVGRGMIEHSQIAQQLGYLQLPPNLLIRESDVRNYPARQVLCVTTGSQGEPLAALSRIAVDDHRHVAVGPEDRVVFSARSIPGNEKAIDRVVNHLARRGADVVTSATKRVHVSGHGSEEELKLMLSLVRPRCFVPIHGEYRQRSRYARLAERIVPRDARPRAGAAGRERRPHALRRDAAAAWSSASPTGRVLIDGPGIGEVGDEVLRDRRHLAEDGLVVPVLAINKQTGGIEGVPDVITRGLVLEPNAEELLREAGRLIAEALAATSTEERTDPGRGQGEDPVGVAPVLPQAFRPAAAGAAGDHGDIASGCRFDSFPPAVRVPGRRAVCAGAHLAHRAGHLRPVGPGVVLPRGRAAASPANFIGRVGAFLAELSFQVLGFASFLIPVLCRRSSAGTCSGAGTSRQSTRRPSAC